MITKMEKISRDTWIMTMDRRDLEFTCGQYISVGPGSMLDMREYSIYSSPKEDCLQILFREIEEGYVSKLLAEMKAGEKVKIDGPFGEFVLPVQTENTEFLFVATGTGIAPFHSFITTRPGISYTLLHGCRTAEDSYESGLYSRYIPCITREDSGNRNEYQGRVTGYITDHGELQPDHIYACGNSDMIYEVMAFFREKGYSKEQLHGEVYF